MCTTTLLVEAHELVPPHSIPDLLSSFRWCHLPYIRIQIVKQKERTEDKRQRPRTREFDMVFISSIFCYENRKHGEKICRSSYHIGHI
uniref:Uncharacterized protein n=1 Tax=Arundo donax TaxID=35708 RepID=A0A0A9DDW5_ARUDO